MVGSSEARSLARSRAAMFVCETRSPSTERISNDPVPPCPTWSVPIRRSWSWESESSTPTIRTSAPPRTSAAWASGESARCGFSSSDCTDCASARCAVGSPPPPVPGVRVHELVHARRAHRLQVVSGERLPDHAVRLAVEMGVVEVLQMVDRARALRRCGHERAGERRAGLANLQRMQRLPLAGSPAELVDELGQVVGGTGPGRVATEARAELGVAQELREQRGGAGLFLRRRHLRLPLPGRCAARGTPSRRRRRSAAA